SVVRYRFTVEDYHRMAEAGILGEDDRVELIAGEVVEMGPVGPVHVACVALLNTLLATQIGPDVLISVQSPIRLPDNTEPQPDLALLRRRVYRAALPGPADALLVIEVADTSRDYDRTIKLPRYAAAGIPESWLLDLVARRLERQSDPRARWLSADHPGLARRYPRLDRPTGHRARRRRRPRSPLASPI